MNIKVKYDPVFKKVFADPDNADILRGFIADMLRIPRDEIGLIEVLDQELPSDRFRGKFCRLDMRVRIGGRIVNIELQIKNQPDYRERTLYYWSKMFSDTLRESDEYGRARECICINILGFVMFDTQEYCSEFGVYEKKRHEMLSDKLKIYFFEMGKLRNGFDPGDPRELWLKFIDSESEEELRMIEKNTTTPEMKKATMVIRHMSADEKRRYHEWLEEQMKHDEASYRKMLINEGRMKERETLLKAMRENGFSPEMIAKIYGDEARQ